MKRGLETIFVFGIFLILGLSFVSAQNEEENMAGSSFGWLETSNYWNNECQAQLNDTCNSHIFTYVGNNFIDSSRVLAHVYIEEHQNKIENSEFISLIESNNPNGLERKQYPGNNFYIYNYFYLPLGYTLASGGYGVEQYAWYSNKTIITIDFYIPNNMSNISKIQKFTESFAGDLFNGFNPFPSDLNFGSENNCLPSYCELNGGCVPVMYRTDSEYCGLDNVAGYKFDSPRLFDNSKKYEFFLQLSDDSECIYGFECINNHCFYKNAKSPFGKCSSKEFNQTLFQRWLAWFKRVF